MNKKSHLLLVFILGMAMLHAQDSKSYFSELIPSSPGVSELGKFGEVPVGKYTGMANVSVPIHRIDFQELPIPISLSYTASGIKVAQEASWVGLNWNLSASASISRQVKGYDDLIDNGGVVGYINSKNYTYPLSESDKQELVSAYATNPIDTEPDVFQVTLFGQSVKFLLNKKQAGNNTIEAQVLNDANTRIFYDVVDQTFEVVNSTGYRFFFETKEHTTLYRSGTGAVQNITTEEGALGVIAYQTADGARTLHRISGWHLDRIAAPNGELLHFEYQPGFHLSYPSFSQSISISPCGFGSTLAGNNIGTKSVAGHITGFEARYLTKIYGDFGSVEFGLTDRLDISSRYQTPLNFPLAINVDPTKKPKKLSTITLRDLNGKMVARARLSHTYFNEDKSNDTSEYKREKYLRLKLDKVTLLDQVHEFDYISPNSLPAKDSRSEDFWGYYNGKQNTDRIPSFGRFLYCNATDENVYTSFYGADRSADVNYGQIGTLQKITYPTGGSTEFEYESHTATVDKPDVDINNPFINSTDFSYNYQYLKRPEINNLWTPISSGDIFTINTGSNLPFEVNLRVSADIICGRNCNGSVDSDQHIIRIQDVNDPSNVREYLNYFAPGQAGPVPTSGDDALPNGTYQITFVLYNQPPYLDPANIQSTNVKAWFVNAPNETDFDFEEFNIGGTRIKSITNKDTDGSFISKKSYTYTEGRLGQTVSSGVLMNELLFHSRFGLFDYTPQGFSDSFTITSGTPLNLDYAAQGSHIGYSFVEEQNETETGETNGKTRCNYINFKNQHLTFMIGTTFEQNPSNWDPDAMASFLRDVSYGNAYLVGVDPISYDFKNGDLFSEEVIDAQGNTETFVAYNNYEEAIVSSKTSVRAHLTTVNLVAEYPYTQHGTLNLLKEKETFNEFYGKSVKTKENLTYNERYLPESNTTFTSEDNTSITEYVYYPFDTEYGIHTKPFMQDLITDNRIVVPVLKRTEKNGELVHEELSLFDEFSTTNMILPSIIQDRKGSRSLENRLEYKNYDAKNNPLEVVIDDSPVTSYIWGYNDEYPIAKIENATYAQIASAMSLANEAAVEALDENDLPAINALRNHSSFRDKMVYTYAYDPLIGVTTMTDPRGYEMYYEYDVNNRLKAIKDQDDHIISESTYQLINN